MTSIERGCGFYCSPDGHSCKWLLPMVATTNYPSWSDLTALSLDELAAEIERRQGIDHERSAE